MIAPRAAAPGPRVSPDDNTLLVDSLSLLEQPPLPRGGVTSGTIFGTMARGEDCRRGQPLGAEPAQVSVAEEWLTTEKDGTGGKRSMCRRLTEPGTAFAEGKGTVCRLFGSLPPLKSASIPLSLLLSLLLSPE